GTTPVGLILDPNGNIFGVTNANGTNNTGTLFKLSLAPASQLAFATQPSSTTAGQTLNSLTINIEDADGYIVSSDNSTVTIAVHSGPNGGTLLGTFTAAAQNGVATFNN